MLWLKQSTAVTLKIGPFVDQTNGYTAETGLTIAQADVRLSMNGGNMAQKNEGTSCTHDEIGIYGCPIDTTDTGTLGRLQLFVHESGALPVWHEFMVVPANVWDSMFGADMLKVDVHAVDDDETAANNAEAFFDGTGYAGTNNVIPTVTTLTGHTDQTGDNYARIGAPAGASVSADVAAVKAETATIVTDTNELQTDLTDGGRLDLLIDAIKAITDALPDSGALSDLATILADTNELQGDWTNAGRLDTIIDAILADSGELQTDWVNGGRLDLLIDAILADTNELQGDWADGGRLDLLLDAATTGAGSGAITFTYTLTSTVDSSAIADAQVWVTSDQAGNTRLASGTTDANGEVVFYLDAGTVYVWAQKSGWNFTNPDTETVA